MKANRIVLSLAAATALIAVNFNPIFAEAQEHRLNINTDQTVVSFDVRDLSRREAVERLFAGTDIEVKWLNSDVANQHISGMFSGTQESVLRRLLAEADFVIGYNDSAKLSSVLILGPARNAPKRDGSEIVQLKAIQAIPVATDATQLDPMSATPVASDAVQMEPIPAAPVASDAVMLAQHPAIPMGSGATQLEPIAARPVPGFGTAPR